MSDQEPSGRTDVVPSKRKQVETDERGRRRNASRRARKLAKRNADAMPVVEAADGPRAVRVVDAPLADPIPDKGLAGVFRRPYLLRLLVRREIAKMYSASVLGLLWSYIQPAMRFGVYYMVFGVLLSAHKSVPNFAIHLFCGLVFTGFFSEVTNGASRAIWSNRSLVVKMAMPREIFPISQVVVGFYHIFPQVLLLVFFCAMSGFTTDWTGLACLLLGLAIIIVFSTACGLLFSAANVYYRDFQRIVATVNQMVHFVVPMMYTFARISQYRDSHPILYQVYLGNPIADAVVCFQRFFWYGVNAKDQAAHPFRKAELAQVQFPPDMILRGLLTLLGCLVFLWWTQRVFTRLEPKFPERI